MFPFAFVPVAIVASSAPASLPSLSDQDVVWTSPSVDSAGSMPIGNGEVVLNVWAEQGTGDLVLLIARTDSLSEVSQILKLGRLRVHMSPSPFLNVPDFRQHLRLKDGCIDFSSKGAKLRLIVDSGANVVHLNGTFGTPTSVKATVECWRNAPRSIPKEEQGTNWSVRDAPFDLVESADVFVDEPGITWYHRNASSVVPKLLELQSLAGLKGAFDPLVNRTFGGRMESPQLARTGDRDLKTDKPTTRLDLKLATYTAQTKTVDEWLDGLTKESAQSDAKTAAKRTRAWWNAFWKRSWVLAGEPDVARGYVLQRYVQACQGRGQYPIKFNGGYYTVEPKAMGMPFGPDFRKWGDCHWLQNVRHTVHPMMATGDFEMTEAFFRLYEAARPLCESRAKAYHGCEGVYFPETMTDFGTYSGGDYGWKRDGLEAKDVQCPWWANAWNQGPEIVALMLDRWDYTRDEAFLKQRLLPMAESVLRYFDTRFKKDEQGRIVLDPTQVIETYWQGVVNDMPSTAGLIATTERLCALPNRMVSQERRAFFEHMRKACPELPIEVKSGRRELGQAQQYKPEESNCENAALYAVWPFRLATLARPALLDEAKRAYAHRKNHLDVGWGYDGNAAALLGMTDEAARILQVKVRNSHPAYRWPATWGPNFDWLPDQNHGGNLLNTANLMLLQAEPLEQGGAIRVLPAWPKAWDVDFKLRAPGKTTVRCVAKSGRIEKLEVSPASRAKDVVWPSGWGKPTS